MDSLPVRLSGVSAQPLPNAVPAIPAYAQSYVPVAPPVAFTASAPVEVVQAPVRVRKPARKPPADFDEEGDEDTDDSDIYENDDELTAELDEEAEDMQAEMEANTDELEVDDEYDETGDFDSPGSETAEPVDDSQGVEEVDEPDAVPQVTQVRYGVAPRRGSAGTRNASEIGRTQ